MSDCHDEYIGFPSWPNEFKKAMRENSRGCNIFSRNAWIEIEGIKSHKNDQYRCMACPTLPGLKRRNCYNFCLQHSYGGHTPMFYGVCNECRDDHCRVNV